MSASMSLVEVSQADLTDADLVLLISALDYDNSTMSAKDVLTKILSGVARVWRFDGGFFVGQVVTVKSHKELFILASAGDGLVQKASDLVEELKKLGKLLGCSAVTTEVQTKELVRFYETRLGFEVASTVMEIKV